MIMTRSRNGSRNPSHGGSPIRRGGSPVRRDGDDDDRSPSPSLPRHKSRGRMQTPSAAANLKKSATKSDSPPRGHGRTMTRSASRAASRGGSPQAADNVKIVAAAAAAHYQADSISHLTQNIPTMSGHQVFLVVDTVIRPQVP